MWLWLGTQSVRRKRDDIISFHFLPHTHNKYKRKLYNKTVICVVGDAHEDDATTTSQNRIVCYSRVIFALKVNQMRLAILD